MSKLELKPRMTLQKWYGNSIRVPKIGHWRFADFVISSLGLVGSIVREKIAEEIHVVFMKGGTAHADYDKKQIAINAAYLDGLFLPGRPAFDSDTTLSVLMGLEMHEAAHFAFTPKDLIPMIAYMEKKTTRFFNKKLAFPVANIIEDIYIEAEVDREVPSLTWTLNSLNDVFFSSVDELKVLEEASELREAPENLLQLSKALNVLIFAKTRDIVDTTPFLERLFKLTRSAVDASLEAERCALCLEVYDCLMEKISEEECKQLDADGEKGEGAEAIEISIEMAEGLCSSALKKEKVEESESGIVVQIRESLEMLSQKKVSLQPEENDSFSSLFIESIPASAAPIEADVRYAELTRIARQRSTVNRPYGLDRNRGHNLRKLYRIATDSKVFAESVSMNNYKPMEVIILIDCSGSMGQVDANMQSRIGKACRAALGAAVALVEARCEVAVFGHTADTIARDVVIYHCKRFNEPVSVLRTRLGGVAYTAPRVENRDGSAISFVAKKFTRSNRKKLLIVFSDGAPLAEEYWGMPANTHSQKAVNEVRSKGIDVLSISITPEAHRVNRFIYGHQHDVFNEDPNVIASIVRSLILA